MSVIVYIDNSNIYIEAQKYSGRRKNYLPGVQDVTCRIDYVNLVLKAFGETVRPCPPISKIYGSDVEKIQKALESLYFKVFVFPPRKQNVADDDYSEDGRMSVEKRIDTSLVADAVEDICLSVCHSYYTNFYTAKYNIFSEPFLTPLQEVIIFSGDQDLIPIVEKCIRYGIKVQIWSFDSAITAEAKSKEKENPGQVKVCLIEEFFDEISYSANLKFKLKLGEDYPLNTSFILQLDTSERNENVFEEIMNLTSDLFRVPTMGNYLEQDQDKEYLVVVCQIPKSKTFNNYFKDQFSKVKPKLEEQPYIRSAELYVSFLNNDTVSLRSYASVASLASVADDAVTCKDTYWCKNLNRCRKQHDILQKDVFKRWNKSKPIETYKYKSCDFIPNCERHVLKKCFFAHDDKDKKCRCKHQTPHFVDACPAKKQTKTK